MKKCFISLLLFLSTLTSFAWNSEAEIRNYYAAQINSLVDELNNLKRLAEKEGTMVSGDPSTYDRSAHVAYAVQKQIIPQKIDRLKEQMNDEINKFRTIQQDRIQQQKKQEEQQRKAKQKAQQEAERQKAQDKQRRQEAEEARRRAEEQRRAEEARRREEERRRREEERRRKYEMEYNREMARTEESFRHNIANADIQKENMQYLRNEKIDNIEIKSGYIPSSGNSTMTAQKRSKAGILPTKNKSQNQMVGFAQKGSSLSLIVIGPDTKFSFKQESEWEVEKFLTPINVDFKEFTNTTDADVWNDFDKKLTPRQRDMLAIQLMQLNNGNLPKFVYYTDKDEYVMEGANGKYFLVSPDGRHISTISESSMIDTWKKTKLWDGEAHFKDKKGKIDPKLSGRIKLDFQYEYDRKWIDVGEVVSDSRGVSISLGPEAKIEGNISGELPSASAYAKIEIEKKKEWPKTDKEENKDQKKFKYGAKYNLGQAEAKGGADLTLSEVSGNGSLGFSAKILGKYYVVVAKGDIKGSIGAGANGSAKVALLSSENNKVISISAKAALQAFAGVKASGDFDVYVYDSKELHKKMQLNNYRSSGGGGGGR